MKKYILLCVVLLAIPSTSYAVKPPKAKPYPVPESVPATIDNIRYITGYPPIDTDKYLRDSRPRKRFELGTHDAAFRRTRMKQDGSKKLEDIDIIRFRYSDIKELYFGQDAIQKAREGSLPTAEKSVPHLLSGARSYSLSYLVPLHEVLMGRNHSPIIIVYQEGGRDISLVFIAPHGRAKALYQVLAREAGLKVKPPVQY